MLGLPGGTPAGPTVPSVSGSKCFELSANGASTDSKRIEPVSTPLAEPPQRLVRRMMINSEMQEDRTDRGTPSAHFARFCGGFPGRSASGTDRGSRPAPEAGQGFGAGRPRSSLASSSNRLSTCPIRASYSMASIQLFRMHRASSINLISHILYVRGGLSRICARGPKWQASTPFLSVPTVARQGRIIADFHAPANTRVVDATRCISDHEPATPRERGDRSPSSTGSSRAARTRATSYSTRSRAAPPRA